MKVRVLVIASLAVLSLSSAARASPVHINAGEIGKAFSLLLPTNQMFMAWTWGGEGQRWSDGLTEPADTELFLFDSEWHPIVANDDNPANPPGSLIFTTTAGADPSVYHLIVTIFNAFPRDQQGNPLFDQGVCGTAGVCLPAPGEANQVFGGNFSNLGGRDGNGVDADFYLSMTIGDQDVEGTPELLPTATPEPATISLFGFGIVGVVATVRRRKLAAKRAKF